MKLQECGFKFRSGLGSPKRIANFGSAQFLLDKESVHIGVF
jgi:hypothetical protein